MQIGELFLNLGIKGTEKTVGALSGVKKGLSETASMSLEAKAGIVAAMYALERLFATSGAAGTGLTNFNSLLGVSAQTLQQYQYAARQAGVSNQETENTFKSLQGQMTKTLNGEGAPKGLARVSMMVGGMTAEDLLKYQQAPQLLIQKLQEYAGKEKNAGLKNEVLKSFGIGDNMIAAFDRQAFTPAMLKKAPTYSDREIGALDKANIAWSNLGTKIEMAVGHFNAKHGGQIVNDISKIVDQVFRLVDAFQKLSEKLKLFDVIGDIFKFFAAATEDAADQVDAMNGKPKKEKKNPKSLFDIPVTGENLRYMWLGLTGGDDKAKAGSPISKNGMPDMPKTIAPRMSPMQAQKVQSQNVNQTTTVNFNTDVNDHKKTTDSVKKAIQHSYRQMSAQSQGT